MISQFLGGKNPETAQPRGCDPGSLMTVQSSCWSGLLPFEGLLWGEESTSQMALLHSYMWQVSVPWHLLGKPPPLFMGASPPGCLSVLTTWQLTSPKQVIQKRARHRPLVFYNVVLEVTITLAILFYKNESLSPAYTQWRRIKFHLLKGMSKNL